MKSVQHGIGIIAKKSDSNVFAKFPTQPLPPINLPIVCEDPKDTESNTSKDTNNYITVNNALVERSSKRQKTLS